MPATLRATTQPISQKFHPVVRKAAAVALTRTAWDVRSALIAGMQSDFDRPTPFTLRAFRVDQATAGTLEATVWAQPLQARYLLPQIEGGDRNTKGFEKRMHLFGGEVAVPAAGAKLNQYGNMSLSFIKKVASDAATAKGGQFFIGTPHGWLNDGQFDGLWTRSEDSDRLIRVMSFVDDTNYQERFDVHAIAQQKVSAVFESQLAKALAAFSQGG